MVRCQDGNQRGFSFSLNLSSAVAENSIALSLKINNDFRSYLDLVQSGLEPSLVANVSLWVVFRLSQPYYLTGSS